MLAEYATVMVEGITAESVAALTWEVWKMLLRGLAARGAETLRCTTIAHLERGAIRQARLKKLRACQLHADSCILHHRDTTRVLALHPPHGTFFDPESVLSGWGKMEKEVMDRTPAKKESFCG